MKKKEKELRDEYIPAEIVSDDELDDTPVIEGVLISKPKNAPKGEKIIPTEGKILQALPVEEKGSVRVPSDRPTTPVTCNHDVFGGKSETPYKYVHLPKYFGMSRWEIDEGVGFRD